MAETAVLAPEKNEHNVLALKKKGARDLRALAEVYFQTQVLGQSRHTEDAKRRDLQRFLDFYTELVGNDYDPAKWWTKVTRQFLNALYKDKQLSQATVCRVYASVRRFARWTHGNVYTFPLGCPTDGVPPPEEPTPEWKGLERKNQVRLMTAFRMLGLTQQRGINQGVRDYAVLSCLLRTGLRISDLLGLDREQFDGKKFLRVRIKGNTKLEGVPVPEEARTDLEAWLQVRGEEDGPLFTTQTGKRLGRSQYYTSLKRAEKQANTQLPEDEKFTVTPHVLRHTFLRWLAETKGIQYAMKASGHKTDRYIWRYVEPKEESLAAAVEEME